MVVVESHRPCWTLCDCLCSLLLPSLLLTIARPVKLAAFPTSLSDCQTPTGWNCSGFDDRENDLFLCDTNTCKFDGECLRIGDSVTCDCQFKCHNDYVPVCGSNGVTFRNECYLRGAACKQQSEILVVSEGSCVTDGGSGSGDGDFLMLVLMQRPLFEHFTRHVHRNPDLKPRHEFQPSRTKMRARREQKNEF
ncbi:hypothetical protein FKM82_015880 [Ascaphus truei]